MKILLSTISIFASVSFCASAFAYTGAVCSNGDTVALSPDLTKITVTLGTLEQRLFDLPCVSDLTTFSCSSTDFQNTGHRHLFMISGDTATLVSEFWSGTHVSHYSYSVNCELF